MEVKPGYKQTEVGVIPEEWEVRKIVELCAYQNGKSLEHLFTQDDGLKVISIGNYSVTGSYIDNGVHINRKHRKQVEKFVLSRNDLTMSLNDKTSVGAIIGRVLLIQEDDLFVFNQRTMRLKPKHNVSPSYLHHAINADRVHGSIVGLAKPGTQIYVNTNDVIELRLPTPTLPEQRAIATALSDVDGLLGGLDRLIAKKRDLKQAAMQQLLTGQTRLPGFSGEWEVKRLGDLATFYKGKGLPKSALSESGAGPCIHYGELFTRYSETIGEIFSCTDTSEGVFRSVANDVLMPTSDVTPRGLAKASCVRVDGVILGGDILVIRSDTNRVHGPFLSLVIRYEETQVLQLVTGSTVYHLYGGDMKNFTFSMPSLQEQTAIAEVLTEMDAELEGLEQRREKTRALKQAMMQELLTGRTRLVSPEVAHA